MARAKNEPKDLGVRIGSKKQQMLESIKEKIENETLSNEISLEINQALLPTIKRLIDEEKEKFK